MSMNDAPNASRQYTVRFLKEDDKWHRLAFSQARAEGSKFAPWIAAKIKEYVTGTLQPFGSTNADLAPTFESGSTTSNESIDKLREEIHRLAAQLSEDNSEQAVQAVAALTAAVERLACEQQNLSDQLRRLREGMKHSVATILTQPDFNMPTAQEYVDQVFR